MKHINAIRIAAPATLPTISLAITPVLADEPDFPSLVLLGVGVAVDDAVEEIEQFVVVI
jgi:hypothetical protein